MALRDCGAYDERKLAREGVKINCFTGCIYFPFVFGGKFSRGRQTGQWAALGVECFLVMP